MLQTVVAEDNISITVYQPQYEHIPVEAQRVIESKLGQILTTNGVMSGMSDRFVITAKVTIMKRDVMPTNPVKISEKMDVTIIIGDAVDDQVFGRTTLSVTGIGVTEAKAQIQAYQRMASQNAQIQLLVTSAKQNIVDYYTNHCSDVLTEAERMAKMDQLDEALQKLLIVPQQCHDCYVKAQKKALTLYQVRQQAIRAEEQAQKEEEHRKEELERQKEEREWEFKVQQYKDQIEQRKRTTDALRDVGVAIGNNLPKTITKTILPW